MALALAVSALFVSQCRAASSELAPSLTGSSTASTLATLASSKALPASSTTLSTSGTTASIAPINNVEGNPGFVETTTAGECSLDANNPTTWINSNASDFFTNFLLENGEDDWLVKLGQNSEILPFGLLLTRRRSANYQHWAH
jgi:hypothetical protein